MIGKRFVRFSTSTSRSSRPLGRGAATGSETVWLTPPTCTRLASRSRQSRRLSSIAEMAGVLDGRRRGPELGSLLVAGREAVRAARVERAAGRDVDQRRRRALDRHEAAMPSARRAGSTRAGPRCRGAAAAGRPPRVGAELHRAARVHDHHRLGDLGDDAQVVRDQDHADVELLLHPVDQLEDLRLHGDVERRRRLVGDQEIRVVDQRHGDHRPLAHAARELVRVVLDALARVRDPDRAEQLDGALQRLRLRDVLVDPDRLDDLVADRYIGCRHAKGSWKIIAMSLPRTCRSSADTGAETGRWPMNRALPEILVRLRLSRPSSARFVTLLPEPDSPTIPSVSPRWTRERQAVDGLDDAVRRRELDGEVLDLEQRLGRHW